MTWRVQRGRLHPVIAEVYSLGGPPRIDREWWMASVLTFGRGTRLSDSAAVELYGWLRYPLRELHVTTTTERKSRDGIRPHHRTSSAARRVIDRIPVTSREQTILDCATHVRLVLLAAGAARGQGPAGVLDLPAEPAQNRPTPSSGRVRRSGPVRRRTAQARQACAVRHERGSVRLGVRYPAISFQTLRLSRGRHVRPEDGTCVAELVSMLAGERYSDRPRCACPALTAFLRGYNDGLDDDKRQDLFALASELVGTRGPEWLTTKRGEALVDLAWRYEARVGPMRLGPVMNFAGRFQRYEAAGAHLGRCARRQPECHRTVLATLSRLARVGSQPGSGGSDGGRELWTRASPPSHPLPSAAAAGAGL